jgi:hypothetical protein
MSFRVGVRLQDDCAALGRERRAMKTIVVRYEAKPECVEENRHLIEKVFAQLDEMAPGGFGYTSLQLEDGVTFIHLVRETGSSDVALTDVPAFKEFVAHVADRCTVQPVAMAANVVGSYRFFES